MAQRLHPVGIIPADSADGVTIVDDGSYLLVVEDGRIVGLIEPTGGAGNVASVSQGPGISVDNTDPDNPIVSIDTTPSVTYGQTGKTFIIGRTSTSGSTWAYMLWTMTHYMHWQVASFTWDVHTADTYTLSIDGEDVGSVVAGSGAGTPATITLGVFAGVGSATPKPLTPGPHAFKLRGTTARTFYYNNGNAPTPTGTYIAKLVTSPWQGPNVVAAVPGTLTFDAEGVLT